MRIDRQARRKYMLVGFGLLLGCVTAAVLIASLIELHSKAGDHIAVIGNFFALGALVLALGAGVVALLAFAEATGLPNLQLKFILPFSHPNEPTLPKAETRTGGEALTTVPRHQTQATVYIKNDSHYSGKNPAVIVHLNNMVLLPHGYEATEDWKAIEYYSTQGITVLRWDGPTALIHGNSEYRLPPLILQGLAYGIGTPSLTFEILADGYRRQSPINIPIRYKPRDGELPEATQPEWL